MVLHVRHSGNAAGPVLLLLHGMPTSTDVLDALGAAFSDRALVVTPDLPGYGESPAVRPYSFDASHALIEDAVLQLAPGRDVHVIGYSAGGYRGFDLAARGRLPVRSVAALASIAGYPPPALQAFAQIAGALRAGLDLEPIGARMLTPAGRDTPELVAATRRWMAACPPDVLAEEFDACASMPDLHEAVAATGCAVLLRVGELDANVVPDAVRASAARLPGARLEIVPGQAHALPLEDHAGTLASLQAFLSSVDGPLAFGGAPRPGG